MRTFTTTHTVYTFDELSRVAKERAVENERVSVNEMGFDDLSDALEEHLKELLDDAKIKHENNLRVYYSFSYSQGDGAMFEGTFKWRGYTVAVKHEGMYYHYNSKSFGIETRHGNDAKPELYAKFNELYIDIAQKLEKYGYDYIEYETADEQLIENIKANEYEFYDDGRMV